MRNFRLRILASNREAVIVRMERVCVLVMARLAPHSEVGRSAVFIIVQVSIFQETRVFTFFTEYRVQFVFPRRRGRHRFV